MHWADVEKVFGILAYMSKTLDSNGLDLYFTQSREKFHEKHSTQLVAIVRKRMVTKKKGLSDMSTRLEHILEEYISSLKRGQRTGVGKVPHLSIYIFTDGIWTPSCDIVPIIKKTVMAMVELGLSKKQVGLQFVSFGNSADGLGRMRLVDDHLGLP